MEAIMENLLVESISNNFKFISVYCQNFASREIFSRGSFFLWNTDNNQKKNSIHVSYKEQKILVLGK